jgi:hypothetical protein
MVMSLSSAVRSKRSRRIGKRAQTVHGENPDLKREGEGLPREQQVGWTARTAVR